jgi:chromosome segregation ATPase
MQAKEKLRDDLKNKEEQLLTVLD